MVSCTILALMIGFRGEFVWPDTSVYTTTFRQAPLLWDFSFRLSPYGYVEKGYYFLASVVKTIYNDWRFYLIAMGGLSMWLLYKNLQRYCIVPLIGLTDYVARFLLNRDFIQMRSSLAILICIWAIQYAQNRKFWNYYLLVALAYSFHHMALIAVPFYFLVRLKLKNKHIYWGLALAFILSQTAAQYITLFVDANSSDLNYETYVQGTYVTKALGLRNPMIYFQIAILVMFMYLNKPLVSVTKYYSLLRTGYFYSTLFLILFCNYTALSGRTSTMYASLEMFMLPLIGRGLPRQWRTVYYIGTGLVLLYFFYVKITTGGNK